MDGQGCAGLLLNCGWTSLEKTAQRLISVKNKKTETDTQDTDSVEEAFPTSHATRKERFSNLNDCKFAAGPFQVEDLVLYV